MKVGILFNCQHVLLADLLRQLMPRASVVDYDIGSLYADEAMRDAALVDLATCDQVLSIYIGPERGPLATEVLTDTLSRVTVLPGFSFGGFHPDTVYIHTAHGFLPGFTHHYHSRLAAAGFLTGRSAAQTAGLYNTLVLGRAGYYDSYAQERMLACQVFDWFGIDLAPMFDRWIGRGCFMHSINHPKSWCFADIGLALFRYAGLPIDEASMDAASLPDRLERHPTHPVLPPLARRLGVASETVFKSSDVVGEHRVPLEQFISLEYESFAHAGRQEMEATPGVLTLCGALA